MLSKCYCLILSTEKIEGNFKVVHNESRDRIFDTTILFEIPMFSSFMKAWRCAWVLGNEEVVTRLLIVVKNQNYQAYRCVFTALMSSVVTLSLHFNSAASRFLNHIPNGHIMLNKSVTRRFGLWSSSKRKSLLLSAVSIHIEGAAQTQTTYINFNWHYMAVWNVVGKVISSRLKT